MFYELKYDVTIYDVPVAMMLSSRCYRLRSMMLLNTKLQSSPFLTMKATFLDTHIIFEYFQPFLRINDTRAAS